ncbi:MAG: VCBS repeat-containing protein, partial [Candidatus Hydrothermae bacterium]|nr:VCBS repeat-containing protein [Candidatus Hydrothermae bacterium]
MRRMILVLLMAEGLWGMDFRLKWALEDGVRWYTTVIRGADADHDGRNELIFRSESLRKPVIYELTEGEFQLVAMVDSISTFWEVGDLDGDGLTDVVGQRPLGSGNESDMLIIESREYYGYPDTVVWEGYLWGSECGASPLWVHDFDGDGKVEIMNSAMRYIYVWENEGDNDYEFVYGDTLGDTIVCLTGGAYGDFDGDGRVEMAFSDIYGHVIVMESVGDNDYEVVWSGELSDYIGQDVSNVYDNFSVGDMDGDGKMEFVLHGVYPEGGFWRDDIFVFEAVGDNEYEVVWYDSLRPNYTWPDYGYGRMSDVGDVDGDGVPEVVLSTTSDIYVLKAVGDDS